MRRLLFIAKYLEKLALREQQIKKLHSPESQFGIISARRPEFSSNEDKQRHTELIQYIQDGNFKWMSTAGVWPEDIPDPENAGETLKSFGLENSIVVYDAPFDVMVLLARYFDQDGIVYKPEQGPVGLYDLNTNMAQLWLDIDIQTNAPKPRKLLETLEEDEEMPLSTGIRDTQVFYEFADQKFPFTDDTPIYYADISEDEPYSTGLQWDHELTLEDTADSLEDFIPEDTPKT